MSAKDYVAHLSEGHGLGADGAWSIWNDRTALRLWSSQDGDNFLAVFTLNDRSCWQVWVEAVDATAAKVAKR